MRTRLILAGLLATTIVTPAFAQRADREERRAERQQQRGENREARPQRDFGGGRQAQRERVENRQVERQERRVERVQATPAAPVVVAPRTDRPQRNWQGNAQGTGNRQAVRGGGLPEGMWRNRDRDGDGVRNRVDRDRDGDGIRNGREDRDRDGIPNARDRDRDGDGVRNRRDFDRNNNGTIDRRFDRNNNGVVDRRVDRNRDGVRDRNWNGGGNWNREWRNDRRYDWQRYRTSNRYAYRLPRYYSPYGYGYGYQRFGIGIQLDSLFFGSRYWINDPWQYRLPPAEYPYRWVRYYNDAMLVDTETGYVEDVIYDFFY